ncbi:hypothetical protein MBANPS3_008895 [Mucor bainieri]
MNEHSLPTRVIPPVFSAFENHHPNIHFECLQTVTFMATDFQRTTPCFADGHGYPTLVGHMDDEGVVFEASSVEASENTNHTEDDALKLTRILTFSLVLKVYDLNNARFKTFLRYQTQDHPLNSYKPLHKITGSKDKPLFLFVGDRGFGIGLRIKKHQRFGGPWKQNIHGRYTPTVITYEYNSSQTCLFCFRKLCHPMTVTNSEVEATNGSFVCFNDNCPNTYKVMCRDQVSALAIGLAGLASVLFGVTLPCFDPRPSHQKQNLFNDLALTFLEQKQQQAPPSDGGNTG